MAVVTIEEMHYDFRFKADKVDTLANQDFSPAEIDWLLNEAQDRLLKSKYGLTNTYRAPFENIQKRIDDLSTLVVKYPRQPDITPVRQNDIYEIKLSTLEEDYLFMIRARAYVQDCDWANLKPVEHDDLNEILIDPFNKPSTETLPITYGKSSDEEGSSIYIYPGSLIVTSVRLEYLKQPAKMSLGTYVYLDGITYPRTNCELPEHVRSELVDLAVSLAKAYSEDPQGYPLAVQAFRSNE